MKAPNHQGTRAAGTLALALALMLAAPAAALADPGTVDLTVSVTDPTGTTGTTTVTAATTGTTATVSVPRSTSLGTIGSVTMPGPSGVSTGSGPVTISQNVTPTGPGVTAGQLVTTSVTDASSPALAYVRGVVGADQGLNADIAATEPTSRTSLTARAQANAVLCLLAQASVDPSRAVLSSLCNGGPSHADGGAQVAASNAITGTDVSAAPTIRAAACLLALVSAAAPRTVDARDLANASLSTLCGGATASPSTAASAGDVHLTEDRTSTDISSAPVAAVAACLLANATVGTTTATQLATLCGVTASPSTLSGGTPVQVSDGTTGASAGVGPAANAALCLLLDALATIPSDPTDATAVAALSTACGGSAATLPSSTNGSVPTTATVAGGTGVDVSPSVNGALCLLAQTGVSVSGPTAQLSSACGTGAGGVPTTTPNGGAPSPELAAVPAVPAVPAGPSDVVSAPQVGAGVVPVTPEHGVLGVNTPPRSGVLGLTGLPSTSTEMLGGFGILLIALGTSLAMRRRQ